VLLVVSVWARLSVQVRWNEESEGKKTIDLCPSVCASGKEWKRKTNTFWIGVSGKQNAPDKCTRPGVAFENNPKMYQS